MKRNRFTLTAAVSTFLIGGFLLAGCSVAVETPTVTSSVVSEASVELDLGVVATEVLAANANSTTTNDDEWTLDRAVNITLDGSNASADGDGVVADGSTVMITAAGTYVLAGQFDGQVVVDTADEGVVALVLDGAEISSSTSAAIAVLSAEDVAVSLNGSNILSSTGADAESNAALFSDADLTIEGDTVTVDAGGDALKSDNEEDETRGYVYIAGGTVDLIAGDDGVQAQTDIVIAGGSTTLDATDDGLKAEVYVVVSGGESIINSAGDGIDSNGSILITGGTTTVFGSPEDREGALDTNGSLVVDSGTVLAVGTTFMATAPDASSAQGWLSATLDQAYGAGLAVQVLDEGGTVISEFTSIKSFQSVVISDAAVVEGSTYTITVDGAAAGTVTAGVAAAGSEGAGGGAPGGQPRP